MAQPGEAADQGRSGGARRFVLLCAPEPPAPPTPPESLRKAIAARDAEVLVRADPYQAMADLVQHEHAWRSGAEPGPMILIIVEPERFPHAADLADAAARLTPHAVCWRFAAGADPQLAAFSGSSPDESSLAPSVVRVQPGVADTIRPRPTPAQKPRLRLAGDPGNVSHNEGDASKDGQDGEDEPPRPVLSEEELEMLLSDDWERQTGEGGPA